MRRSCSDTEVAGSKKALKKAKEKVPSDLRGQKAENAKQKRAGGPREGGGLGEFRLKSDPDRLSNQTKTGGYQNLICWY